MNDQILSAYDISQLSDEEISNFSINELNDIFNSLTDEYNELNSEYLDNDRDMYPPDWWDQYVFPVYIQRSRVQSSIIELEKSEDND